MSSTATAESLKVLQVMAGADHGGAETAYVDFSIALKEYGVDVICATRANPVRVPQLKEAGIPVTTLPFGGPVDLYTPMAIKQLIAKQKPQIVQTWMSRAGQKLPAWRGSDKPYRVISRLGGYYKLKHFPQTDMFATITPDIKRFLFEEGVPDTKVVHINNFAELEEESARPVDRAALQTPEDAPLLLTLSRLHESKALDILIVAMKDVPKAHLWIAGEGPDRAALEQQAKDLGISDRVHFLGWRSDRAALLATADICVFPSRYEPFGTVFVQAWASKTPLIVSDAAGPAQYVRDEEDCLQVPKDNASALTQAIKRLSTDPALAKTLIANGWKRYQGEFTKEETLRQYVALYRTLIEELRAAA